MYELMYEPLTWILLQKYGYGRGPLHETQGNPPSEPDDFLSVTCKKEKKKKKKGLQQKTLRFTLTYTLF